MTSDSPRGRIDSWSPHPGGQLAGITCPVFELLIHGDRGGGKTELQLADFARDVGRGFGSYWRGLLLRRQFKDLSNDLIPKSHRFFRRVFGDGAVFVGGNSPEWRFPDGEVLMFRHAKDEHGYWDYHGSEIPWIGYEELTQWPTLRLYDAMKSVCRSAHPRVAKRSRIRATTNPLGVGHTAVKARWIDCAPAGRIIKDEYGERAHIQVMFQDNLTLQRADPKYKARAIGSNPDPAVVAAWGEGDWDIIAGGMFDDVWDRAIHVVSPFHVPESWRIDRTMDWGESKPFVVHWWAESDGTGSPTVPPGTLFCIGEWYGWTGQPNQGVRMSAADIGKGIVAREEDMGIRGRVEAGPGDFPGASPGDVSIIQKMASAGASFWHANRIKKPGSRVTGWASLRERLAASTQRPMESPGLFFFDTCYDGIIRTLPVAQRSQTKIDDVDTESEDHALDSVRYRVSKRTISLIGTDSEHARAG